MYLKIFQTCMWNLHGRIVGIFSITMTTTASQITSLAVVYSIFIQAPIKENIKAPRHWPFCGEFTGIGEFPAQRASNAENVSIWWRHHVNVFVECLLDNSNASKAYILVSENSTSIICGQQESESRPDVGVVQSDERHGRSLLCDICKRIRLCFTFWGGNNGNPVQSEISSGIYWRSNLIDVMREVGWKKNNV